MRFLFSPGGDIRLLLLSLITLFAGPLLYLWMQRNHVIAATLDRVLVGVLLVIITLLLIPEVVGVLGWWTPFLAVAGYLLPGLLEKIIRQAAQQLHLASLAVAALGLVLHAMLDGAGLASSEIRGTVGLALVIVLHRFGVGMMLWMVLKPAFGERAAWFTLAAVAAATVFGFVFSAHLLPLAGDWGIAAFQAVIIGTIVHSLVHREHVHH